MFIDIVIYPILSRKNITNIFFLIDIIFRTVKK